MNRDSEHFRIRPLAASGTVPGLVPGLMLALVSGLVPFTVEAADPFDIEAATRAYLDSLSAEDKLRSNAYFEGGYWLRIWDLLYGLAISWLVLHFGLAGRMRDFANRVVKRDWALPSAMAILFFPLAFVLSLPLSI